MRIRLAFILAVLSVLHSSSCTRSTDMNMRQLDVMESVLNESPDSILGIIRATDPGRIKGKKAKARFALLHSIALDKNAIDIRSDSIISPALRYYSFRKSSYHKLQTFYYTARVYENNGDLSMAMEYLATAESMLDKARDRNIAGLIYTAKGRIYNKMLDYHLAGQNFIEAASEYRALKNENRYIANQLRAADCMLMCGETKSAGLIIKEIETFKACLSQSNLNRLYLLKLRTSEKEDPGNTDKILEEYLGHVTNKAMIDWLYVARIYIGKKKVKEAYHALEKHRIHDGLSAGYHYWLGQTLELDSRYKESLEEFKKYDSLSGNIGRDILSQDTRFVEERFRQQSLLIKEKNRRTVLSLAAAIILLGFILVTAVMGSIHKELKIKRLEEERLQNMIDTLMLEREELASLENKNQEGRKIISDRLRIIDQFVMSDAFNDSIFEAKASENLKAIISDRAEFVRQNRLIFNQSASRFINHLTEKGLTDIEIDHCCLYAIGMNGKMVTTFTNAKRHYHIGSDVRKKLGLSTHDTNISIYIRNLYQQMHS